MPRENGFTHNVGTGGMDPVSYAVLPGKEDGVFSGSPTLVALGSNVYDSLGKCVLKYNLSVQGVESPNFKEYRRLSSAVEALLQRGPGAPEPPDEVIERISRGPDMGMEPEQKERAHRRLWPRQLKLWQRTVCRPGVERGCAK